MNRHDIDWAGNFTAIVTPFAKNGDIDKTAFQENINLLIEEGVNGIIATGDTGEAWALTEDERVLLYELAVEVAGGRVAVVAGVSHMNTDVTIKRGQQAKEVGVDGVMVTPPYYVLPSEREIVAHYQQVSDQVELPIMLYTIPKRVGVGISPSLLSELADIEYVIAVKQSSEEFSDVIDTIELCGDRIYVLAGHSVTRGFPCIAMGADGVVSSVEPQIMGKQAIDLYALSKNNEIEAARNLQHRLVKLDHAVHGLGTFPSALKAAMNLVGRPGGHTRRPVFPLSEEKLVKLRSTLAEIGLL
jgi:4-hydroxy-tetrahydrodipicolinate synthase